MTNAFTWWLRRLGLRLPRLRQRLARCKGNDGNDDHDEVGQHLPLPARRLARSSSSRTGRSTRSAWPSTRSATCTPPTATRRPIYQLLRGGVLPELRQAARRPRLRPGDDARTTTARPASPASPTTPPTSFPQEYRDNVVHRQRGHQPHQPRPLEWHGSTLQGDRAARLPHERRPLVPARWTSSSARTARCTSPTSTTGSSATTRCRSTIRGATGRAAASGGSSTRADGKTPSRTAAPDLTQLRVDELIAAGPSQSRASSSRNASARTPHRQARG